MNSTIRYGHGIPTEAELRLLGDLAGGKRALELGVSEHQNAIAFAIAGAKALAVDPDPEAIDQLRKAVTKADEEAQHTSGDPVRVECHVVSDLADLGFATSGSISAVLANHTLDAVDDLPRVLRQVHRVLRPGHPFVISMVHPYAHVPARPYGTAGRTIGDWFTHLARTNFRIDQLLELGVSESSPAPTALIIRARKEGD